MIEILFFFFDSLTVKRVNILPHAAEQAIAWNALQKAENTRLLGQNQERTYQKTSNNHLFGWARLMTSEDSA